MKENSRGFTLVEIMVVIAVFSILATIAVMETRSEMEKSAIQSQIMTLYGELMGVRLSAMNLKRPRAVIVKPDSFQIYSSDVTTVAPVQDYKLRYPMLCGDNIVSAVGEKVRFDEKGFTSDEKAICVEPSGDTLQLNGSSFDSVVISGLRLRVGKRTVEGAACKDGNIQLK